MVLVDVQEIGRASCRERVLMSVGPLCVSLSSLLYLQYLSKCFRNSICLGPGKFPYLERTFSADRKSVV